MVHQKALQRIDRIVVLQLALVQKVGLEKDVFV